ncbi:MAG: hypothetical protein ACR2NN_19525 [Bryobacteraceae bacterium]
MAEFCGESAVLPRGCREHAIQKATLFRRLLFIEHGASVLCEFQNLDSFIHVRLICLLVLFNRLKNPRLLSAPLARLPVKERYVDSSIQLVFVERFEAILQPLMIAV